MVTRRSALGYAHLTAVLFGLTGIFGALINASAGMITLGRAVFALLALGLVAAYFRASLIEKLTPKKIGALLLAGACLTAHWVTFFIAVKVGGVAVATLGFASFPAFIALVDVVVFRDRLRRSELQLLALISVGLMLVTPSFEFSNQGTVGLLWGLLSGFSFALLAVTNRRGSQGMSSLQIAFWQNVVVAGLVLPFTATHVHQVVGLDWLYLVLLGIFCTGWAQFLFVKSLEVLSARTSGMIVALEPVYAIACAWWLFAETPSARMLCGAALIISATLLTMRGGTSN